MCNYIHIHMRACIRFYLVVREQYLNLIFYSRALSFCQATSSRTSDLFDRQLVTQQVRSLQLLEAVHIMTGGW